MARSRRYYLKHRDKIIPKQRILGKRHHAANREKENARHRERDRYLRKRALEAHGGACCKCCNEQIYEFLTIDYINGRSLHGHSRKIAGSVLYRWLAKNNYPSGFQVLCLNCNYAKSFYSSCPHQKLNITNSHPT